MEAELCAIEFFAREDYERFVAATPQLRNTTTLTGGNNILVVVRMADFPMRDIKELFDRDGRAIGKLIGPDALAWIYQIREL